MQQILKMTNINDNFAGTLNLDLITPSINQK